MALANARGHRVQAALLAVTLAACGGLLTFGLAAQAASGNAFDRLWHRTNGADLWLYFNGDRATPAAIDDALRHTPGVRAWTSPEPDVQAVPIGVVQKGFGGALTLREWPASPDALGHPLLVAGRAPQPGERDALVVDLNVSRTLHLPLGSTVAVPTPAGPRPLRVVGLEVNAESCAYPLCNPSTQFVARGGLAALGLLGGAQPAPPRYDVALRVHGTTSEAVRDAVGARLPAGSLSFASSVATVRQFASLGYATQSGLLLAFALVAAVAAALLIVAAIGGAVRADTRGIGLLKAVGFSKAQLRVTALAEYVGIAFAGALVGAVAACAIAPRVLGSVTRQFGTSAGVPVDAAVVALVASIVLTAVVVLGASRRAVRLETVSALRADTAGAHGAAPLWRGPVVVARAIGDVVAGRARSLLSGVAMALAAGAIVLAVLFQGGVAQFIDHLAFDGGRAGDLVTPASSHVPVEQANAILRATPGVVAVVRERITTFTFPGSGETFNLRLRDGDTSVIRQPLQSGRQLERAGEVVVGYGLAHRHHLRVGGDLTVDVGGTRRVLRVVGINREINNLGQMATTLPASVPDVHPSDAPLYLVRLAPRANSAAVASAVKSRSGGLLSPTVIGPGSLPPILRSIRPVVRALAIVLALLTALGVFNTVLLGVQERRRELGLVRAVGMDRRQVLAVAVTGTLALALAAGVVAVPLALVVGRAGIGAITAGIGVGRFSQPVPPSAIAVGPGVVLIALIGAIGPAWSASRTDVIAVLREE